MKKIILLLFLIVVIFISGCDQFLSNSNTISYSSIKDLSQNPSTYKDQIINVKGKLNSRLGGYSLEDSDGYWVWIEDNCIEKQREYKYNSQLYVAKGTWLSPEEEAWFSINDEFRLSCTISLS
ncbi:MAG: hypothetical protein AABY40_03380 [Nanoarchaeota archaeon]